MSLSLPDLAGLVFQNIADSWIHRLSKHSVKRPVQSRRQHWRAIRKKRISGLSLKGGLSGTAHFSNHHPPALI